MKSICSVFFAGDNYCGLHYQPGRLHTPYDVQVIGSRPQGKFLLYKFSQGNPLEGIFVISPEGLCLMNEDFVAPSPLARPGFTRLVNILTRASPGILFLEPRGRPLPKIRNNLFRISPGKASRKDQKKKISWKSDKLLNRFHIPLGKRSRS